MALFLGQGVEVLCCRLFHIQQQVFFKGFAANRF